MKIFLDMLCACDWITPSIALARTIGHGGDNTLFVDIAVGRDRIRRCLDAAGIESWGYMPTGDRKYLIVSVDKGRGRAAAHALERVGSYDGGWSCGTITLAFMGLCIIAMILMYICK